MFTCFRLAHALEPVGLFLGLGEGGEQHTGEDAYNGNHNQQFNQRKRFVSFGFHFIVWSGFFGLRISLKRFLQLFVF